MNTLLVYAVTLLLAVLLSELAHRSVLSAAVIFLVAGFVTGQGMLNWIAITPENPVVGRLAELALFTVLFTDGMRAGLCDLRSAWALPGRALLLGLPLTWVGTALLGHYVAGVSWPAAFLIAAALSPTDPVFAAAIVGREEIPKRLRHLLNVESGLNDGLALPLVMIFLAYLGAREFGVLAQLGELGLGVAIGIALPWFAIRIERSPFFSVAAPYEPLFAFSIGLLVYAVASLTHGNEFLAAFAAGATIATLHARLRDEFREFGELLVELLKLAALLVFGALISPQFFVNTHPRAYLFALLALIAVRPAALWLALLGTNLNWSEKIAAYWFGPKGFASVVYGLIILKSASANSGHLFHLIALVVIASILAHSSTDVVVARWFRKTELEET